MLKIVSGGVWKNIFRVHLIQSLSDELFKLIAIRFLEAGWPQCPAHIAVDGATCAWMGRWEGSIGCFNEELHIRNQITKPLHPTKMRAPTPQTMIQAFQLYRLDVHLPPEMASSVVVRYAIKRNRNDLQYEHDYAVCIFMVQQLMLHLCIYHSLL